MPKYNLEANRYFIPKYILLVKPSLWCQKKSLEYSETKYIYIDV